MTDIRVWVDGALVGADAPAVSAVDHGVTVGRRRLRDGEDRPRRALRGDPAPAPARPHHRRARPAAGRPRPHPRGHRRRARRARPIDFGRLRFTVTGGRGPLGSDRHDSDLTHIVTAVPHARPEAHGAVVTVPWVRNERAATAGLKTTSYADNVIALAYAKERGRARGDLRQHARRAVRGHRQQRLRRRRRGGAHAAARQRLPGRHHPRAGARVVRRRRGGGGRGGPAARRARPRRRGLPHLLDQGRLPGVGGRRPRRAGAGAGDRRVRRSGPPTPPWGSTRDARGAAASTTTTCCATPTTRTTGSGGAGSGPARAGAPRLPGRRASSLGLVMVLGGLALVPLPGPGLAHRHPRHRRLGLGVRAGLAAARLERLSQSALYYETQQVDDQEAAGVRKWMESRGMRFHTGRHESDLTDGQILLQCKMYIAAMRLADDFGCDLIGIQYQQGLRTCCRRVIWSKGRSTIPIGRRFAAGMVGVFCLRGSRSFISMKWTSVPGSMR